MKYNTSGISNLPNYVDRYRKQELGPSPNNVLRLC